jgi:hypothetical protein
VAELQSSPEPLLNALVRRALLSGLELLVVAAILLIVLFGALEMFAPWWNDPVTAVQLR